MFPLSHVVATVAGGVAILVEILRQPRAHVVTIFWTSNASTCSLQHSISVHDVVAQATVKSSFNTPLAQEKAGKKSVAQVGVAHVGTQFSTERTQQSLVSHTAEAQLTSMSSLSIPVEQ